MYPNPSLLAQRSARGDASFAERRPSRASPLSPIIEIRKRPSCPPAIQRHLPRFSGLCHDGEVNSRGKILVEGLLVSTKRMTRKVDAARSIASSKSMASACPPHELDSTGDGECDRQREQQSLPRAFKSPAAEVPEQRRI